MMNHRQFLSIIAPLALLISAQTPQAAEQGAWDGAWTGSLGNVSTISVTIANNKVVNYSFRGAPIKIAYDKVADGMVSFGDPNHYKMTLTKTSDTTASANYHGRTGYSTAVLTKN